MHRFKKSDEDVNSVTDLSRSIPLLFDNIPVLSSTYHLIEFSSFETFDLEHVSFHMIYLRI